MKVEQPGIPAASVRFDVESPLGRLVKWLRILGFDAAYPCKEQTIGRFFITAKQSINRLGTITVRSDEVLEQLRQVLDEIAVSPAPNLFFTRCLICNLAVKPISREHVPGRVPEGIAEMVSEFNECPGCGRIYWQGSHSARIKARLKTAGIRLQTK